MEYRRFGLDSDILAFFPIKQTLRLILENHDYQSRILPLSTLPGSIPHSLSEKADILLILYYDDFEIVNPIGTYRKKHKLGGIYFSIANLDPRFRSKLSAIHPIGLLKCAEMDDDLFQSALSLIVDEINSASEIHAAGRIWRVRVHSVIGDTPASAAMGYYYIFPFYIKRLIGCG